MQNTHIADIWKESVPSGGEEGRRRISKERAQGTGRERDGPWRMGHRIRRWTTAEEKRHKRQRDQMI